MKKHHQNRRTARPACLTLLLICVLCVSALTIASAATSPVSQTRDLKINSTQDSVGITIQKPGTQSANAWEVYRGSTLELAIPGTNTIAVLKQRLGLDSGTCITVGAGIITQAFNFTFSAAPIVVTTQLGNATTTTNVLSITTTNFILQTTNPGVTNKWIAVGAP